MQKWKYIMLTMEVTEDQNGKYSFGRNMESFNKHINAKGEDGWEIIETTPVTEQGITKSIIFTFKKPSE